MPSVHVCQGCLLAQVVPSSGYHKPANWRNDVVNDQGEFSQRPTDAGCERMLIGEASGAGLAPPGHEWYAQ